jgi:hypothetical protein
MEEKEKSTIDIKQINILLLKNVIKREIDAISIDDFAELNIFWTKNEGNDKAVKQILIEIHKNEKQEENK